MTAAQLVETLLDEDEIDNIACDFIETEVGRLDWMNNWENYKRRNNVTEKVQQWLMGLNLTANPVEIVNRIDQMIIDRPGKWQ